MQCEGEEQRFIRRGRFQPKRETPDKFLGIEDQRVVVVADSHSETDIFRRPRLPFPVEGR